MLFRLSNLALTVLVLALVAGTTAAGIVAGRYLGERRESVGESVGAARERYWASSASSWPSA